MEKRHLINNQIKANKIMLLSKDGDKLGELSFQKAIEQAHNQNLDLVQVGFNQKDNVAICKIMNYGSFMYHENKTKSKQEALNRKTEQKTVSLSHKIGEKDYQTKMKRVNEFLEQGRKVKIILDFKTFREANNRDVTEPFITKVTQELDTISSMDSNMSKSGYEYVFMIKPKKASTGKSKELESNQAKVPA